MNHRLAKIQTSFQVQLYCTVTCLNYLPVENMSEGITAPANSIIKTRALKLHKVWKFN